MCFCRSDHKYEGDKFPFTPYTNLSLLSTFDLFCPDFFEDLGGLLYGVFQIFWTSNGQNRLVQFTHECETLEVQHVCSVLKW